MALFHYVMYYTYVCIVWSVKKGDYDCNVNVENMKPVASSSPKCWYDPELRATVPSKCIFVYYAC